MLVRCAAFEEVGGFDASLITYSDDLDFSLRLKQKGYALLFVPSARATHGESVNVLKVAGKPFRDYYTMRNRLSVVWKRGSFGQKLIGIPLSIIWYGFAHALLFLLRGEKQRTRALLKGMGDFFDNRTGKGDL
jgi:GT2 family glycosyltransferase